MIHMCKHQTKERHFSDCLELLEDLDHSVGSGSGAAGVLAGDEAAIDNMEVIPDTRGALV